jgi:alkylation response protein AidB-like acyl-CoA dehydrogenase
MDIAESAEDLRQFRETIRAFIAANLPPDLRARVAQGEFGFEPAELRPWLEILYEAGGWTCPSLPKEFGGPGWSEAQRYIFDHEMARNYSPMLPMGGPFMLAPTLVEFGTPEQIARFMPGILKGTTIWAQGFSEPNAGSDLSSLKCRAERRGDHYVVNGTKIWTSHAHISDWLFGLFRTDSSGRKQEGITFLMFNMQTPGITVKLLPTFEGTQELNQVMFDDVIVPADQRLGAEGKGWTVAKFLLGQERFGTADLGRTYRFIEQIRQAAAQTPCDGGMLIDEPFFAARLAEAEIDARTLEITEQRLLFGEGGGNAAPILKIRGTELQEAVLALWVEAMGYHACAMPQHDDGESVGAAGAEWAAKTYFNYRKTPIWGGSNEVMRNILAKSVLGL